MGGFKTRLESVVGRSRKPIISGGLGSPAHDSSPTNTAFYYNFQQQRQKSLVDLEPQQQQPGSRSPSIRRGQSQTILTANRDNQQQQSFGAVNRRSRGSLPSLSQGSRSKMQVILFQEIVGILSCG